MPDTPVNIDGNDTAFEIRLPKGSGKIKIDPTDGKRTLGVNPKGKPLQLRFTAGTGDGKEVTIPLGWLWQVTIEEVPAVKVGQNKTS
jgi:hypothetical protein